MPGFEVLLRACGALGNELLNRLVEQTIDLPLLTLDARPVNVKANVQDIDMAAEAQRDRHRLVEDRSIRIGSIDADQEMLDAELACWRWRVLDRRLRQPARRTGLAA
jgi:hypothetical protein